MKTIIFKCFRFSSLFALRKIKSKSFIFLFALLTLISSLPLNILIIKTKGWNFNPIVNEMELEFDTFTLPVEKYLENGEEKFLYFSKLTFKKEGIISDGTPYFFETSTFKFYINQVPTKEETDQGNVIVLIKDEAVFYRENGKKLIGSFSNLNEPIHFDRIANETDAKKAIIEIIETVFSGPYIFSSVLIWTIANIFMQTVLMLAICAIFLLVRVNYQKVATYREYLKMYVGCFVIPTVVSVLIGLIGESTAALTPVILQMGTALMMIGTIYKGSKTEIPPAKRLKDAI
ncbi:MAG TPA: DUF1189 family protein [Bacilli bacterium]|nr:DUF1189 family protein [Bacilli bacterium]